MSFNAAMGGPWRTALQLLAALPLRGLRPSGVSKASALRRTAWPRAQELLGVEDVRRGKGRTSLEELREIRER